MKVSSVKNNIIMKNEWAPAHPIGEGVYSSDDLINAYLQGKKNQYDEERRILSEQFSINLEMAKLTSVNLFNLLIEKKIDCSFVSIMIENINSFEALFVIPMKDYISNESEGIYELFTSIIKKEVPNNIYYSFVLMPNSSKINKNRIHSDGYTLTYGKK